MTSNHLATRLGQEFRRGFSKSRFLRHEIGRCLLSCIRVCPALLLELVSLPECEEDFLPLDVSNEIVLFHLTQFFDEHLGGQTGAETANPYDQASMWLK